MSFETMDGSDPIPLAWLERVKLTDPEENVKARLLVSPHVVSTLDTIIRKSSMPPIKAFYHSFYMSTVSLLIMEKSRKDDLEVVDA